MTAPTRCTAIADHAPPLHMPSAAAPLSERILAARRACSTHQALLKARRDYAQRTGATEHRTPALDGDTLRLAAMLLPSDVAAHRPASIASGALASAPGAPPTTSTENTPMTELARYQAPAGFVSPLIRRTVPAATAAPTRTPTPARVSVAPPVVTTTTTPTPPTRVQLEHQTAHDAIAAAAAYRQDTASTVRYAPITPAAALDFAELTAAEPPHRAHQDMTTTTETRAALDAASVYKASTQSAIRYAEPLDEAGMREAAAADRRLQLDAIADHDAERAAWGDA